MKKEHFNIYFLMTVIMSATLFFCIVYGVAHKKANESMWSEYYSNIETPAIGNETTSNDSDTTKTKNTTAEKITEKKNEVSNVTTTVKNTTTTKITETTTQKPATTVADKTRYTEVKETVYAKADMNLRNGPGTSYTVVGEVKTGHSITRVAKGDNGWSKVIFGNKTCYAASNYLTTTKPVEETTKAKETTTQKAEETTEKRKSINDIDTSFNDAAFSKAIFSLVNNYRAENGLSKLTYDNSLEALACVRAKEASKTWAHTRPNGSSYSTVFTEYHYSATFVGENLANGSKNAEKIFQAWLDSPSHKENIVHSGFTKTGIAIFETSEGTYYIAETFSN